MQTRPLMILVLALAALATAVVRQSSPAIACSAMGSNSTASCRPATDPDTIGHDCCCAVDAAPDDATGQQIGQQIGQKPCRCGELGEPTLDLPPAPAHYGPPVTDHVEPITPRDRRPARIDTAQPAPGQRADTDRRLHVRHCVFLI